MTWSSLVPLPDRDLSPNGSRGHWSKTSRARRAYRDQCNLIFRRAAPREPFEACTVRRTLRICRKQVFDTRRGKVRPGVPFAALNSYRPIDSDNASAALKPLLDALQDAHVIKTDRASHCRVETVEFEYVDSHAFEGVWVEVS